MSKQNQKILFVLTNHDKLGAADRSDAEPTGFHLSEAAEPWEVLTRAGVEVDFASPRGRAAPIDPGSLESDNETNRAFLEHERVKVAIKDTLPLRGVNLSEYDGVYFPGGHGTMWDLPNSDDVERAVRTMFESDKIVAAVCHGPAALVNVKLSNGRWLVDGKTVSAFTNEEEKAVEKTDVMPFLLATKLIERGANHKKSDNFEPAVAVDGTLVTGQNPASARQVGEAILDILRSKQAKAA